jgi:invasion protein IalB
MRNVTKFAAPLLAAAWLTAGFAAAQQPPTPRPAPRPAPAPAPHAQPQQPPPAPAQQPAGVPQEPQSTTATYGDWLVRCVTQPGPPPQKNCDMEQVAQNSGGQPISRVGIPMPAKGQPPRLIILLPNNVSIAGGVKVEVAKDRALALPFRRCVPAGCIADTDLKDEELKHFRAETEPGKILYRDAGDRDVVIPISFKGFAQAFDALLKQ